MLKAVGRDAGERFARWKCYTHFMQQVGKKGTGWPEYRSYLLGQGQRTTRGADIITRTVPGPKASHQLLSPHITMDPYCE